MEMDSLCDVVSFGVAPAVLVKAMIDQQLKSPESYPLLDRYVWPMLAIYVCCAALRLARYNVESTRVHRDFFYGMPSPGAAGCVASLAILITPGSHHLIENQLRELTLLENVSKSLHRPVLMGMPFMMLGMGVLMVSRVHYPHVGDRLLRGRKSFMHLLVIITALALIVMHPDLMLAIAFNGYMLFGLVNEARLQLFPSLRPPDWNAEEPPVSKPPAPPEGTPPSAPGPLPTSAPAE
jgi:CDP-diacylglycerol--serine O-phosphatidyltransferase